VKDYTAGIKPSSSHYLVDTTVNDHAKVIAVRDSGADDSIISEHLVQLLGCNGYTKKPDVCDVLGSTAEMLGVCERVKLDFGSGLVVY
jgi:hypothetical protein